MNASTSSEPIVLDANTVFAWCAQYIGELLNIDSDRIAASDSLDELGLDSASATSMVIELENRFGLDVPVAMVFSEPTLGDIAERIAQTAAQGSVA